MALRGRRSSREQEEEKVIEINAGMQGSLSFKDEVNLQINKDFRGHLQTKGILTIGSKAHVEADIEGDSIIIEGTVIGNIIAHKMLVLMPTATVKGDIANPKLNIVEGATFHGKCDMMDERAQTEGSSSIENLLNLEEVANYLEIDINEIESLAKSGKIPGTPHKEGWQFERAQIDTWAASGQVS